MSEADRPQRSTDAVHFYWRPGCGFCSRLRRGLDELGIQTVDHNIWEDAADAAVVRRYARGNETVPTVIVGEVGMVNPSAREVGQHLTQFAPQLLPAGFQLPEPGIVARLFGQ